jgi:hypothetical protein
MATMAVNSSGPLAPPRRESKIMPGMDNEKVPLQIPNKVFSIPTRKPSLSIVTKVEITVSSSKEHVSQEKARTAPLPSPTSMNSPSMNPLQRLSNLASLMVYVIWFDIPLTQLLVDWNLPGNRYFKFRANCERMLAATRLSPSVVVVGLKYMERVKNLIAAERASGQYPMSNEDTPFANESVIWASCLLLSHKYLDDKHYSNPVFAGVNTITTPELNTAERECLRLLDFKLAILENEYSDFRKSLQGIVTESIKSIGTASPSSPITTITSRGPTNAALLHPKSKRTSPYQTLPSPGILEPEQHLWSPDSAVNGGPLRPRDKRKVVLLQGQGPIATLRSVSTPAPAPISAPPRNSSFSPHYYSPMDIDSSGPATGSPLSQECLTDMKGITLSVRSRISG